MVEWAVVNRLVNTGLRIWDLELAVNPTFATSPPKRP